MKMKIKNVNEINKDNLLKIMSESQLEYINNSKCVNLNEVVDNLKLYYNTIKKPFKKVLIDEKLIDSTIEMIIGYKDWLYEMELKYE